VIVGQHGIDSSGWAGIFVLNIDTVGNIRSLDFHRYPEIEDDLLVNSFYYDAVLQTSDGGLVVAGNILFSNNLFLLRLDSMMTTVGFENYDCDFKGRYTKNIVPYDSIYYITGLVQKQDNDVDIFVQKTAFDGQRIWEKTYSNPAYWENGGSVIVEDGGLTVLIGEWTDPDPTIFNNLRRWTKLVHIDTSGQILWQWKSEENEEAGSPNGLVKIGSNYLYFTRPAYKTGHAFVDYGTQIVCRDSSFNLVWRKDYSNLFAYQGFNDMVIGPDGFLYVTGQIYDEVMWAHIFKIDPMNGDVMWQARDTGLWRENWGSRNVMEGNTVLPSGSVVAVGYTWAGLGFERGFLIKATKDGCIDTICTTSTIDAYLKGIGKRVKVYPNPTTDYLIFDTESELIGLSAEIYDLNGHLIQSEIMTSRPHVMMLDEAKYGSGMYVWRLVTREGEVLDVGKAVVNDE
jgi:hypothetical protein